ncbi:phage tail protein [Escherichia coli]|uniref:gp53-like domain-containing protein n=1 Tax=Escherichia coli TaxID=562 RepID=UPI001CBFF4EC|nr:phage tail protein [Escherichia coli]
MNRSDSPKKQPKPFGVNGQRGAILPTTPAGDNSASYEQGFPPITMILKSAGGLPPKGQDMNQILYELSALGRWSSTGALNTFDSEFASEISGYPSGAMLISDDGERIFINTTEGNLSDPNSNGAGWKDVLSYLGLGEAAKRDVGTGDNQIPDMGAFASGSGWFRLPGGYIVQFGTFAGNTTRFISGHFPIPFPNQPMVSVSVMSDAVQSDPSIPAPQVLSVNFEHISNSAWRVATSDISQQYRFSYISIGW